MERKEKIPSDFYRPSNPLHRIPQSTFSFIINGIRMPNNDQLKRLARVLGVRTTTLLGGKKTETPKETEDDPKRFDHLHARKPSKLAEAQKEEEGDHEDVIEIHKLIAKQALEGWEESVKDRLDILKALMDSRALNHRLLILLGISFVLACISLALTI